MQRINRLFALNFQGFSFNEEIPSRLLLTGPNGSGKTTRLRVLSLALLGTDKKNGLAPFTSADEASVGVETTLGIKILRGSKMERNPLRVSSVSRIEPTQGEKTAATVDARIERDIRPNVIALELDRVFSLSGRERRRALLDAISAGSETSIAAVLKGLDEDLKDNPAWPRIRQSALGFAASGSPLEYLRALEGAAKAQASEYRAKKAAAEGLLRTAAPTAPTTSVEAAKKALAKADAELLEISNAAAAGKRGAQDRARLQREHASALAGVPEWALRVHFQAARRHRALAAELQRRRARDALLRRHYAVPARVRRPPSVPPRDDGAPE